MNLIKKIQIALLMLVTSATSFAGGFVVVVSGSSNATSISTAELKDLFTKESPSFGGSSVTLVAPDKSSPAGQAFYDSVFGGYKDYVKVWIPRELAGKAQKPKELGGAAAVAEIGKAANGLAIVDEASASGAKVIPVK